MEESMFTTPNVYLTATMVEQTGQYPRLVQQHIISFSFPRTQEVMKAVSDFNSDVVMVRGFTYSEILKRLRTEMYQLKENSDR